jgi:hypothetical protein
MGKATSKFDGARFSSDDVRSWSEGQDVPAEGFRCLRPEFNTFWKKGRIGREVASHLSRCWLLEYGGFYKHLGFRFAGPDEPLPPTRGYRTMYLDLKSLTDQRHWQW